MKRKQHLNQQRQDFLLSFFEQEEDHYEEKEINGFWLVKQYNGNADKWQVAIFPEENFKQYQQKIQYPLLSKYQDEQDLFWKNNL